jgi:serine/threonine protein kinase
VYGGDVKAITTTSPLGAWVEGTQPRQTAITLSQSHGSVMGEMLFVADGISWRCVNDPYYDPEAVDINNISSGGARPDGEPLPPASSSTEAVPIAAEQQGSIHADDDPLSAGAWVAVAVSLSLALALLLVAIVYKIKFQKTEHQRVIATRLPRQHHITHHGLDNNSDTQDGSNGSVYVLGGDAALADTLKMKSEVALNRASIDQQKDFLHLNIRFGSLDGLELGSLVGRGAFARVYKGSWKGCLVAVKCIEWSNTADLPSVANNDTSGDGGSSRGTTTARSRGTASGVPMLGSRTNTATKPPLTVVTPKSNYAPGSEALLLTSLSHPHIVTVFRAATVALAEPPSPMASGESCSSGGGNNIGDDDTNTNTNNNMSRKSTMEFSEELRRADSTATTTAIDQAIDDTEIGSNMSVVDHIYPRKAGYFESWLVMDYCDAGNVETAITKRKFHDENGKPKLPLIVGILTDTARAIAYLHKADIVHGDLKPANIMLQSSGGRRFPIAKVADFGLSSMLAQDVAYLQRSHSKGTVQYMSPELLKSGKVSKASDVYAFAITAWEMYMADFAFQGMTIGQVFYSVVTMGERPEISDNGGVAGMFKTIVNRCWDGDASKRPCFEDVYRYLDDLRRRLVA